MGGQLAPPISCFPEQTSTLPPSRIPTPGNFLSIVGGEGASQSFYLLLFETFLTYLPTCPTYLTYLPELPT